MSKIEGHGHKWMPIMYVTYFSIIKKITERYGYALAAHGSFVKDMDLIAVPWTNDAGCELKMVIEIAKAIGCYVDDENIKKHKGDKPHGRTAYTLISGGGGYIDLSIMPAREGGG